MYRQSFYYDNEAYRDLTFKGYITIYKIDETDMSIKVLDKNYLFVLFRYFDLLSLKFSHNLSIICDNCEKIFTPQSPSVLLYLVLR